MVTKIVEIVRYHNKTVIETVTQNPVVGESNDGLMMSTTLSITIGKLETQAGLSYYMFALFSAKASDRVY